MPTQTPIPVLIANPNRFTAIGLQTILSQMKDIEVCALTHTLSHTWDHIQKSPYTIPPYAASQNQAKPVLLTDIRDFPDGSSLDIIEQISLRSEWQVAVTTSLPEHLYAIRVLEAGARGFWNYSHDDDRLHQLVTHTSKGKVTCSPSLAEKLLFESRNFSLNHSSSEKLSRIRKLSTRELEVLDLIGAGSSTQEIATHLHLSPKTIETYRHNIKEKMMVSNAAELMQVATLHRISTDIPYYIV